MLLPAPSSISHTHTDDNPQLFIIPSLLQWGRSNTLTSLQSASNRGVVMMQEKITYLVGRSYGNSGHRGCSRRGRRSNGSPSCHTTGMKPEHNCSKGPLPKIQVAFLLRVATPMNGRRHRWKGRQAFNGMIKKPPFNNKSNDNCVWYEQEMASSFIFFFFFKTWSEVMTNAGWICTQTGPLWCMPDFMAKKFAMQLNRIVVPGRSCTFCLQCVNILELLS